MHTLRQPVIVAAVAAGLVAAVAVLSVGAQVNPSPQVQPGILPADATTELLVLTADGERTYFLNRAGEVWLFDRARQTSAYVVGGKPWDLTVSPARNALAYSRSGGNDTSHHVWVIPLDPRTGLAAGPERRLTTSPGDVPSMSPDGKWVAFARDDPTGVGQSIVVVPIEGGSERVVVASLPSSVDHIRWAPDGASLYFGVNPPVACVPAFSCLAVPSPALENVATIQRVALTGGQVSVVATARSVVAAVAPSAWPGLSPDGTLVVYSDPAARLITVADTGGTPLGNFVLGPADTVAGWLSGSTLLIRSARTVRRIRSASPVDGSPRLLFESGDQLTSPAWSPDGKTIAIVRCPGGAPCELQLLNGEGAPQRTVPLTEGFATGVAWSPDQRWISYLGAPPARFAALDLATGRVAQLADMRQSPGGTASWLPDSQHVILAESRGNQAERHVLFQQIDLSGKSKLLLDLSLTGAGTATAIDASTAVIARSPGPEYRLVSLGDGAERVILAGSEGTSPLPVLSRDRQWLAVRRGASVLDVLRIDGSSRVTIELPFVIAGDQASVAILPDANELLVIEAPRADAEPGVYRVTAASKAVKRLFTYSGRATRAEMSMSPDGRTMLFTTAEALPTSIATMDLASFRKSDAR
jgi:Tol biopolymer transport system component